MNAEYKVSILRRLRSLLISIFFNTCFAILIYLMFFTENKTYGVIYWGLVSVVIIIRGVVRFKRGTSFMINDKGVTVLDRKHLFYSKDKYNFIPIEHKYSYNFIPVQSSRELEVYESDILIERIDCRTLSHKKFMQLSWLIRDFSNE